MYENIAQTLKEEISKFKKNNSILIKAWSINLNEICNEFDIYSESDLEIIHSETRNQAKYRFLKLLQYQNSIKDKYSYLNLPINRAPEFDKYNYNNKILNFYDIAYEIHIAIRNKYFDNLLLKNKDSYAYIMKGGYYYCDNYSGYTEFKHRAGVYKLSDAISECKGCDINAYMRPIIIDKEEHNDYINSEIKKLTKKIIR